MVSRRCASVWVCVLVLVACARARPESSGNAASAHAGVSGTSGITTGAGGSASSVHDADPGSIAARASDAAAARDAEARDSGTSALDGGGLGTGQADAASEIGRDVTIDYTPLDQTGTFTPRNVGAVWVMDSQGKFVRSLEVYGFIMLSRLVKWRADTMSNRVDAVSSATAANYHPHQTHWNMTDVAGNVVPDGKYTIFIEVTDQNDMPGAFTSFTLDKAPGPHSFSYPDAPYFANMSASYP